MLQPDRDDRLRRTGPAATAAGFVLALLAWFIPAHPRSVSTTVLRSAGEGTPGVAAFGDILVESEQIGPAAMVLHAARAVGDPGAARLAGNLSALEARQPSFVGWGGWDPYLDALFSDQTGGSDSRPALDLFLPLEARRRLQTYLAQSGSIGVQSVLGTREVAWPAGGLVAADRPGGETLDSLVLLTAFLYQGDYLAPALQLQLHALADTAIARKDLGELGDFYLNLLSLAQRLDWMQLRALLRRTESAGTVAEYAQLARVAPDAFAVGYVAALFTDSADRVANYLLQFGQHGSEDLQRALRYGRGAVRVLIDWQVPIDRSAGPSVEAAGALVFAHPDLMLAVKCLGYFFGAFLVLLGLDRWIVSPGGAIEAERAAPQLRAGVLAVFVAGLFIVATEPYLLKAASSTEYRPSVHLFLSVAGTPPAAQTLTSTSPAAMHSSTIISIAIFALLQVMMYFICLQKINQIARENVPALLKLRLMENEENLFDSGLYVGMMGTATALVLQVLGVIDPNLLAAYSSNLFGIVCVALVKIRHVRTFKKRLILEHELGMGATA